MVPARKWHPAQCRCLPCNGTGFSPVPYTGGPFSVNHHYRDDIRVRHIEPVSYQEVQIIQGSSPPDVSKLEGIAATSELFKHRDLDATLMVHATERKHDDRYLFYWHFTIPTLVAIRLLRFATVTHIYSETSYAKSVVPCNLQ